MDDVQIYLSGAVSGHALSATDRPYRSALNLASQQANHNKRAASQRAHTYIEHVTPSESMPYLAELTAQATYPRGWRLTPTLQALGCTIQHGDEADISEMAWNTACN